MSDVFSRQEALGVTSAMLDKDIVVIGAGGLGSPAVLGLTKTGFKKITVIDYDVVEPHNLPSQMFKGEDVGRPKADALIDTARTFMPAPGEQSLMPVQEHIMEVDAVVERLKDADILVLAVDNHSARLSGVAGAMEARKKGAKVRYLVDGRLNGFQHTVYSVDLSNEKEVERYFVSLFEDGTRAVCVQPATFGEGMVCAGRMTLEVLKRALQMEGGVAHPRFNVWEDDYNNIQTTESELFD